MKLVSLIAAMGQQREIGRDNDLMWHLPVDMKFFKDTTLGHPVIMGRLNYDSIPPKYRPFPNRENIIVTRQTGFVADGCVVFHDIKTAVEHALTLPVDEVFVIGGAQIYQEALSKVNIDRMYLTHIDACFPDAHVHFPAWIESEWERTLIKRQEKDDKHAYSFSIYQYNRKA
jgi:dihydrofolate reductase